MIDKSMSNIDWEQISTQFIIRSEGFKSGQRASTVINGKNVKVHKSVLSSEKENEAEKLLIIKML